MIAPKFLTRVAINKLRGDATPGHREAMRRLDRELPKWLGRELGAYLMLARENGWIDTASARMIYRYHRPTSTARIRALTPMGKKTSGPDYMLSTFITGYVFHTYIDVRYGKAFRRAGLYVTEQWWARYFNVSSFIGDHPSGP